MPQAPFFSAIVEKNVIYQPTAKGGIKKLFSSFSDLLNKHQILKASTYFAFIAGNIGASSLLPLSAAIPLHLVSAYLGYQHIVLTQARERKAQFLKATAAIAAPTVAHPTQKNRKNATFNHVFSFVKANGLWWYALRDHNKTPQWKRFYVDKLSIKDIPNSEMIADGQNAMIKVKRENHQEIYYKKVIAEKRVNGKYVVTSLCEEPLAKDTWFTLPIASLFKPKQYNQPLKLPLNAEWAMSHSGDYKAKVVDGRGVAHPNLGVTTVFEFNLPIIRLHDPYVERNSEYEVTLPENIVLKSKTEASASYLFFIGQETGDPKDQFSLFSRYLDYDSQGFNPAIRFTHNLNDTKRRLLPFPGWQKQTLPLGVTPDFIISALQCDNDNKHTVEVRLHHPEDENTFFYKKLDDTAWQKTEDGIKAISEYQDEISSSSPGPANAYGSNQIFKLNGKDITQAVCYSFDPLADFCPVVLTPQKGSDIHLQLYRYKNMLKAFMGWASESWSFRPDPEYPTDASILGKKQYLPVNIKLQTESITIDSTNTSHPFSLQLERQNKNSFLNAMPLASKSTGSLRQSTPPTNRNMTQTTVYPLRKG